jgi:hypothetical protein
MNSDEHITEFRSWVDDIYGTYQDACLSFPQYQQYLKKQKDESLGMMAAGDQTVPVIHVYARLVKGGKSDRPTHLHQVSMDAIVERNAYGGKNTVFMGRMAIVAIYGQWEDHTRKSLESTLGGRKIKLQVPIMGEIGILRRLIVHNRARADQSVKRLNTLTWFHEGEEISPTAAHIHGMVDRVMEFANMFQKDPLPFIKAAAT